MTDSVDESDVLFSAPLIGDLTHREWHAIVDGLYCGVRDRDEPDEEEYDREKHYWRTGWLLGNLFQ